MAGGKGSSLDMQAPRRSSSRSLRLSQRKKGIASLAVGMGCLRGRSIQGRASGPPLAVPEATGRPGTDAPTRI